MCLKGPPVFHLEETQGSGEVCRPGYESLRLRHRKVSIVCFLSYVKTLKDPKIDGGLLEMGKRFKGREGRW
jgi:hypothetical protein